MTLLQGVLAGIGGLATIFGAVYGVFKWVIWKTQTTPDQKNQSIDQQVQQNKQDAESSGRPV